MRFLLKDFEKLHKNFNRDLMIAQKLESPNIEDTLEIKIAIVGFSYGSPTEDWGLSELRIVEGILSESIDISQPGRLLYALGIGYVMGLWNSAKIDQTSYELALAHLAVFVVEKDG